MTTQILLTHLALENVAETGIDPADDVCRVATAGLSRADLLAECLDGADDDRVAGWREYVDAVVDAAHAQLAAEVARTHLQAIGWKASDGDDDAALGLGDSWGGGDSTGLDQGEWSELCECTVRAIARAQVVQSDEALLTDTTATREARIEAAVRLCRAADEEQAVEGDSELTGVASAEQAAIETMHEACDGTPTRDDWKHFVRMY